MKNKESFIEKLAKGVEIRTYIQDTLRAVYNVYKKCFQKVSGEDAKILKHLVDMYHYAGGGYPNENSQAKHEELMDRFAWFVKYFEFMGMRDTFVDKYLLEQHGIKVSAASKIQNFKLTQGQINYCKRQLGDNCIKMELGIDFKEFLKQILLYCDQVQGQICDQSNEIKRDLAPAVEEECVIKRGDFTSAVMFNYRNSTHRVTVKDIERIKYATRSRVEISGYNLQQIKLDKKK